MRAPRSVIGLVALLCLAFGLSACGSAQAEDGAAVGAVGSTADLDFTATTVEGASFEGSSLAGTPTVLWFWAPWCPTCKGQIPDVQALSEEYGDQVQIVGVGGLDDDESAIAEFAAEVGGDVTELSDSEGTVWRHFGITEQSTYVVLDADGAVTERGVLDQSGLQDATAAVAG